MAAQYAHPEVMVDTEWVAQHGKDPNVRLVEVDVDTSAYEQGHIEGAAGWNWKSQLQDQIRRDVVSKEDLEKLLGQSGISNDTTLVLYGDNNNWFAAWALWFIKYYGHRDVRLMNGGRKKWELENRPLTTAAPQIQPKTYNAQEPLVQIRALREWLKGQVGRPGIALVDVRAPAEFSGELLAPENLPQEGAQRGGHIPGAANIPWSTAVNDDGTFKSAEELQQIYGGKGITGDKEVVAYCRIGERSSHTWFVLRYLLGYSNVRNYDGSWTEWGSAVGLPIER